MWSIAACQEISEPPTPPTPDKPITKPIEGPLLLEVEIDPDYLITTGFVFLHNSDGKWLGYSEIKNGEEYSWEIELNESYQLTLYLKEGDEDSNFHSFATYRDIPVDQKLYLSRGWTANTNAMTYNNNQTTLKIDHGSNLRQIHITSEYTPFVIRSQILPINNQISFQSIKENNEYMIVARDENGLPKYQIIPDIRTTNMHIFNFGELKEFDRLNIVPTENLNNFSAFVIGLNKKEEGYRGGYYTSNITSTYPTLPTITLGYLDRYPYNYTSISVLDNKSNELLGYRSISKIPKQVDLPNPETFEIIDSTRENFEYTPLPQARFKMVNWLYNSSNTQIFWNLLSENDLKFNLEFPDEIVNELTILKNIDALKLFNLNQTKSSLTYQEYLKSFLLNNEYLVEYENYTYVNNYY
ncbi:hypothetical protein SAMN04489724_1151 [Algoriphagus locisalis]|uniref:Uncharacterized protein n=2 Tax=Algoriphagus locisalis TaxID=305507 RepID=A0A1I6YQ38_9BACT|nr:hypothetical protein SAMN04489724_1151 [Algoriphagus locisalis]